MNPVIIEKEGQTFVVYDAGTTVEDLKVLIEKTVKVRDNGETEAIFNVLSADITRATTWSIAMEYPARSHKQMAPKKPHHEKRPPPAREWWRRA